MSIKLEALSRQALYALMREAMAGMRTICTVTELGFFGTSGHN